MTSTVTTNSLPKPGRTSAAIGIVLATAYCTLFFVRLGDSWPEPLPRLNLSLTTFVYSTIATTLEWLKITAERAELRNGTYLLLMGVVVPWLVLAMLGRGRPSDIGFRLPNRVGWRFIFVGYVASLPFLWWMARSSDFATGYLPQLERAGTGVFLAFYFVNMLSEHFFFHGVLLAVCRRGNRWPEPAAVALGDSGAVTRALRWIGLAQPTGKAAGSRRLLRWAGLPGGCLLAVCVSAALFGLIHFGKHPRELVLSVPGGLALAYAAYRSNSWTIPFILHLATAGTACLIMLSAG